VDYDKFGNDIEFFYMRPIKVMQGNDIVGFIDDLRRSGLPLTSTPETPLDLHVPKKCWMVIGLSRHKWQFRATGDAITTKQKKDQSYANLVHVFPNGTTVPGGGQMQDNCQLVYFACVDPPQGMTGTLPYEDGFNMHIDLIQANGKRLPLVIDPDIRFPGGAGS
jgi:hypothetical protein